MGFKRRLRRRNPAGGMGRGRGEEREAAARFEQRRREGLTRDLEAAIKAARSDDPVVSSTPFLVAPST